MKLFLKRESLRGERGEDGFESDTVFGDLVALGVFLLSTLGLSLTLTVWEADSGIVVHRKRGVEGLLPPERKPKRAQLLGLGPGPGLAGCLSDMVEAGSRVQKALLQPVPMFTARGWAEEYIWMNIQRIDPFLSVLWKGEKDREKTSFVCFGESEGGTEDKRILVEGHGMKRK